MPAAALDIPTHAVARDPLPFEAGDELAGNLVQVLHQKRERLARRLLRREHLDDAVADQQVVSVAVDRGVGDEVVQVRVVREPGGVHDGRFVVHELAEEPERLALLKACRAKVADLDLETLSLVVQRPDGSIEFRINELQRSIGREPGAESLARPFPQAAKPSAALNDVRCLVEDDQVEREIVEIVATVIQVRRAALNRLIRDRLVAGSGDERRDGPLQEVLIDAAMLVEKTKAGLEPVGQRLTLRMRQSFVVDASNAVDNADVAGFRQKRRLVDESPECQQAVDAAGVLVVAENAAKPHHGTTSMSTRSCFPGSYRLRAFDEASRMRSISGSRAVAHRANPYSPPDISSPARNE